MSHGKAKPPAVGLGLLWREPHPRTSGPRSRPLPRRASVSEGGDSSEDQGKRTAVGGLDDLPNSNRPLIKALNRNGWVSPRGDTLGDTPKLKDNHSHEGLSLKNLHTRSTKESIRFSLAAPTETCLSVRFPLGGLHHLGNFPCGRKLETMGSSAALVRAAKIRWPAMRFHAPRNSHINKHFQNTNQHLHKYLGALG